jgi:RHS repeat-associated protein
MPFGQPMLVQTANADGRTTAEGYSAAPWDGTNPAFVSQYMDLETGLEYFPARYLSSLQGRFQSPDPGNAGANPADPQTWNGYAYVGSNPLSSVDPTGLLAEAGGGGDDGGGLGGAFVAFFVFIGDEIASALEGGPSLSVPAYSGTLLVWDPTARVPSADPSTRVAYRGFPIVPTLPFFPNLFAAEATAKAPQNKARCLSNVKKFIDAHLQDAQSLAASLGNGATAREVLATSGNETGYGGGFANIGNYFGIHGAGPEGTYWTPRTPTAAPVPVAKFPTSSGFLLSGQVFVGLIKPYLTPRVAADPRQFFTLLNHHGYATGNSDYPAYMVGKCGPYALVGACM